jgi:hypothetical protein
MRPGNKVSMKLNRGNKWTFVYIGNGNWKLENLIASPLIQHDETSAFSFNCVSN